MKIDFYYLELFQSKRYFYYTDFITEHNFVIVYLSFTKKSFL